MCRYGGSNIRWQQGLKFSRQLNPKLKKNNCLRMIIELGNWNDFSGIDKQRNSSGNWFHENKPFRHQRHHIINQNYNRLRVLFIRLT